MAFDGIVISALCVECHKKMVGARIDKIYQPEKDELVISVRSNLGAHKLLLCANPSFPRFHLTKITKENPEKAPMFCMLLRKHLSGGKILYVRQDEMERIVRIGVESYDEMGVLSEKVLIVEIMGKHSNIILINNEDKIIDAIIHVDISVSSVRQILPGLTYSLPPSQNKANPLLATKDGIKKTIKNDEAPVWKLLMDAYQGISPLVAREAVYRAVGHGELAANEMRPDDTEAVAVNFYALIQDIKNGEHIPCVLTDAESKKMIDFCVTDIAQYGDSVRTEYFKSPSEAVESFYVKKASLQSIKQKCADLSKTLSINLERCYKKLQVQGEILEKAAKRNKYKIFGDLLTANIYQVSENMSEIRVQNFYSPEGEMVTIPLKTDLSPAKNAQRYYQKYTKEKTAEAETLKQKKLNEAEIDYLESVQEALSKAETNAEITEIRDELIEEGYIKNKGRLSKKKKKAQIVPMHFVSSDGCDIYVGKNNIQNDYVTLKLAKNTDIWFHTKGLHGSHTIIKTDDAMKVSDETYMQAARIAAYYSKGRSSENVAVDYTEVKNVKKPHGAKPGMVIYAGYNTLYVTPDEDEVLSLKK